MKKQNIPVQVTTATQMKKNTKGRRFQFKPKRLQPYLTNWKWTSSALSIITLILVILLAIALFITLMYGFSKFSPVYQKYKAIRQKEHTDSKQNIEQCESLHNKPNPKAVDCDWVVESYYMNVNTTAQFDAIYEIFGLSTSTNQHKEIYRPWFCGTRCDIMLEIMRNNNPACFVILLLILITVVTSLSILYSCYHRCKNATDDIWHTPPSYMNDIITTRPPPAYTRNHEGSETDGLDLDLDGDDSSSAVDLVEEDDNWLGSNHTKTKIQ